MDGWILDLTLFLGATFAAALVAGIAGFAFGLIALAAWLHVLGPLEAATLVVAFGLLVQGIAVWKLRRAIVWPRLWPFLVGGVLGVPLGVGLLETMSAQHLRVAIGAFLILYAVYGLARPTLPTFKGSGAAADGVVGVVNGMLGGATGLAGIVATIWCQMRGWPKDEQRAVFQPASVAVFALTAASLGLRGTVSADTIRLFLFGLPVLLAGTWLGLRLYGRLGESGFRRVVLLLLLLSGAALVFRP